MLKFSALFFLIFCCFSIVFAQTHEISGTVKDESGSPIVGVGIRLKGTNTGVSTDVSGSFKINVPSSGILIVSTIGYESQQVAITGATTLSIVLKESSTALNEVVVTALGVKREKRTLTYATQEVKGAVLIDAKQDNLINALAGKIAGVQITNSSGMPGSSAQILIRGNSTLFGDNTALLVIDGVPVDNGEAGNPGGPL